MNKNTIFAQYTQLEEIFEQVYLLKRNLSVLNWDSAVIMPTGGVDIRGKMLATQANVIKKIVTSDDTLKLLNAVSSNPDILTSQQNANVRCMNAAYKLSVCVPDHLQSNITIAAAQTEVLWRRAREQDDFSIIVDDLTNLINLTKEKAKYLAEAFNTDTYSGLMQEFDYGCDDSQVAAIFEQIESELPQTIAKVRNKPEPIISAKKLSLSIEQQKKLCCEVAKDFGFDFNRGRLDESEHPFSEGGKNDNRITVHYNATKPLDSLFALVHETGHALYDISLPDDYYMQPVGGDMGMTFHEATALFYEMYVGRSKFFAKYIHDKIHALFPEIAINLQELENEFLCTKSSKIRIQSNQIEYVLHIILRYNLEKMLLSGELEVKDLPQAWNTMFYKFFADKVHSNKEGCLQDIHWYLGSFGYFPCYGLGSIMASNLFQTHTIASIMHDPDINFNQAIRKINGVMTQQIFSKGRSLDRNQLIQSALNQRSLDVSAFIEYMNSKYL